MGEIVQLPSPQVEERHERRVRLPASVPYRIACQPDAEWQRCKLEQLRVKWRYHDDDVRFMQRLGDLGRRCLASVMLLRVITKR